MLRDIVEKSPRHAMALQGAQIEQQTANIRAGDIGAQRRGLGRRIVERELYAAAAQGELDASDIESSLKLYDMSTAAGASPGFGAGVATFGEGLISEFGRRAAPKLLNPLIPFAWPRFDRPNLRGPVLEGLESGPTLPDSEYQGGGTTVINHNNIGTIINSEPALETDPVPRDGGE